jgi:hypothetical protein
LGSLALVFGMLMNARFVLWAIGIELTLLSTACSRSPSTPKDTRSPFSFSHSVFSDGTSEWLVQSTNGTTVTFADRQLTVYFALNSTITKTVSTIVVETPDNGTTPGQWVTESPGGIPIMRRVKGISGNQVFYKGEWHASKPVGQTNCSISVEGKDTTLFFDGTKWTAQ